MSRKKSSGKRVRKTNLVKQRQTKRDEAARGRVEGVRGGTDGRNVRVVLPRRSASAIDTEERTLLKALWALCGELVEYTQGQCGVDALDILGPMWYAAKHAGSYQSDDPLRAEGQGPAPSEAEPVAGRQDDGDRRDQWEAVEPLRGEPAEETSPFLEEETGQGVLHEVVRTE